MTFYCQGGDGPQEEVLVTIIRFGSPVRGEMTCVLAGSKASFVRGVWRREEGKFDS